MNLLDNETMFRLQADILALVSALEQQLQGQRAGKPADAGDAELLGEVDQKLFYYTHSLKTLSASAGNQELADTIHELEGTLRDGGAPQPALAMLEKLAALAHKSIHPNAKPRPAPNPGDNLPRTPLSEEVFLSILDDFSSAAAARALSRGHRLFILAFEAAKLADDRPELRFKQLLSRAENLSGLLAHAKQGAFLILLLSQSVSLADEDDYGMSEPLRQLAAAVPGVRLIEFRELELTDLLGVEAEKLLPKRGGQQPPHVHNLDKEFLSFASSEALRMNKDFVLLFFGQLSFSGHILDTLKAILFQALRNAMTHGIEDPQARIAAGKTAAGNLSLSFCRIGSLLRICIEDDGRGFPEGGQELAPPTIDRYSGRNIGLAMMRAMTENLLGGSLTIRSAAGRGAEIELRIPARLDEVQGIAAQSAGLAFFLDRSQFLGFQAAVKPWRMGKFWYMNAAFKSVPLYSLVQKDGLLATTRVTSISLEETEFIVLLYRGGDGVSALLCDMPPEFENCACLPGANQVWSQAFEKAVPYLLQLS